MALNCHHRPHPAHLLDWNLLVHEHVWLYGQYGHPDGTVLVRWFAH